ncbi:Peroxiredoxin-6 [Geodia barretti]|uniref:Peroxiredoxin-6 n=1 Tax=Geodia barretti TaxID=519541 RepID=A0AA35XGL3_GEOBA|nr:Peroxiredoxin-6 [Geodia barretti]
MHLAENIIEFDHTTFSLQSYSELSVDDFPYPIISDPNRDLAVQLGMLDPVEKDKAGLPLTCRAVFIVGPDKKLKLSILYPAPIRCRTLQ